MYANVQNIRSNNFEKTLIQSTNKQNYDVNQQISNDNYFLHIFERLQGKKMA